MDCTFIVELINIILVVCGERLSWKLSVRQLDQTPYRTQTNALL